MRGADTVGASRRNAAKGLAVPGNQYLRFAAGGVTAGVDMRQSPAFAAKILECVVQISFILAG